jgi:hypothetical protein
MVTAPAKRELVRWMGTRGAQLEAKNVFALYKKRKAYLAKRSAPTQFAITNMIVYPEKIVGIKSKTKPKT